MVICFSKIYIIQITLFDPSVAAKDILHIVIFFK